MSFEIKRATRSAGHLLVGVAGTSGAGKTLSALLLARGIVGPKGRVVLIDTESGRGNFYDDQVPGGYDVLDLPPPHTPERYLEAMRAVEASAAPGVPQVCVVDSASHEWEGQGGVVQQAFEREAKTGKAGLQNWRGPKLAHRRWVCALASSAMHIVLCMRRKEKFEQTGGQVRSAGFYTVQDKDLPFELTVSLEMGQRNGRGGYPAAVLKAPGNLAEAFPVDKQIGVATGEKLAEWMGGGGLVDAAAAALRHEAEDFAAGGTEALRAWWGKCTPEEKHRLRPDWERIKALAAEADALQADARRASAPSGVDLADPFAGAA